MAVSRRFLSLVLSAFAREPVPARHRRNVLANSLRPAAEPLERRDLLAAFVEIEGIVGDSTDPAHDGWVLVDAATPIFRSIPGGAVDQQRPRGERSLGEVTFVRQLDRSSPQLMEACALGKFNKNIVVDFTITTTAARREAVYLSWTFHDLYFSSYSIHAESSGPAKTTETLVLTYKSAEWQSFQVDPVTGAQSNEVRGVQAPPTVGLSSTTVPEKRPAGTVVGRLSTPHGYSNETYTYKFVGGSGSRDNGAFKIVGDEVRTRFPLSYAGRKSYSIRVQSKASDGSVVVNTFTIKVNKPAVAVRQRAFAVHH